ncbi:MAG: HAD family hydrolase [Planctomycetia bacterium]|nr:HAD family hydrolase [Planctomycetia bacterium]
MWSGPRNISTAMMRSWDSRGDTFVCDEPLYAYYLRKTGFESDWPRVADWLTGPIPGGQPYFYQKHMAQHLLPEVDRGWLDNLHNCLLIRDPREMLISLAKVLPNPTLSDTGMPQQREILHWIKSRTGRVPPVLDARDVLVQPREMLERLCQALDIPFTDRMLAWPPGRRATDGIWAPHWYAEVEKSTGFQPYKKRDEPLPEKLKPLLAECQPIYDELYELRLRD